MTSVLLYSLPVYFFAGFICLWNMKQQLRGRRSPFNEKMLRPPGYTLGLELRELREDVLMGLLGIVVFPLLGMNANAGLPELQFVWWMVFGLITLGFGLWTHRKYRAMPNLRLGLEGEQVTGQELTLLMRDGAWVFHDIPYQYGNIDHVVIGTGGVFAIETKAVCKPEKVDKPCKNAHVVVNDKGMQFPHAKNINAPLEQAKRHARWIHSELSHRLNLNTLVRGVVALPGWYIENGYRDDVWVVNPKQGNSLRPHVAKEVLTKEQVDMIAGWFEYLSRSVTPRSKLFDRDANKLFDVRGNQRGYFRNFGNSGYS